MLVDKDSRRVADLVDAVGALLEAADLVSGTEPVLDAAHHAQRRVAVALERQHDVDEMLE